LNLELEDFYEEVYFVINVVYFFISYFNFDFLKIPGREMPGVFFPACDNVFHH
jgi:hypothetical protein